jgi:hypothetical protein
MLNRPCHIHYTFVDRKRVSRHAMKDCKTFLKLQEAIGNKQAEARRQGYEGNTNSVPPSNQQANNRAAVTSQHVGQLWGRIEGFCAYHLKLWDFFALLSLKPKGDRVSLRGEMVYSRSAIEFYMTSFDQLFVGKG